MKSLPSAITDELIKEVAWIRHLYKLSATATYRWTDADQDIYFNGNWYYAREIVWQNVDYSMTSDVPTVQFTITDINGALKDTALAEDLRRKPFMIYRVLLNSSLGVIGSTSETVGLPIVFDGKVDNITFDRKEAQFSIISHMVDWEILCPRRIHSPTCQWVFKGSECGYSDGETWCDFTKTRCIALGRETNFGGCEYISQLADKDVNWGQKIKTWGKK